MALSKVTYVNGQTVIGAANLNDIQDEIIANASSIATNTSDIDTLETTVGAMGNVANLSYTVVSTF